LNEVTLMMSGEEFICYFFYHSYFWGVTKMFIANRGMQCEVCGSHGSEYEDCCLWHVILYS
jgi:hypothetical protein